MAYDKIVDSAKLDNALRASANAFRAKMGSTRVINFDLANETGFSETITNLPTGSGDNNIDELISRDITEITSNALLVASYVFYYSLDLETANFPLANSIGMSAFQNCSKLTIADFPSATSTGTYSFKDCSKLEIVNFPLVTSIGNYSFQNCSKLTIVDFPSATSTGSDAFRGCSKLTIADFSSATSVGSYSFYSCSSLTALILRSETRANLPYTNAFSGCYHILGTTNNSYNPEGLKDGYIYVPSALIEDYKTATNWSTLATQFRALEDYTVDGTITGELDPNKI